MANAGGNFYAAPSSPGPVPEVASPFANDDFAYDWGHFQDAPSATPQFTAATSSVTENFARVPNPTPVIVLKALGSGPADTKALTQGHPQGLGKSFPRIRHWPKINLERREKGRLRSQRALLISKIPVVARGYCQAHENFEIRGLLCKKARGSDTVRSDSPPRFFQALGQGLVKALGSQGLGPLGEHCPTPPVANLLVVPNAPSLIARDDNTGNSGDIADAPNLSPRIVNLVADTPFLVAGDDSAGNSGDIADESNSSLRVADLANPPSLIARDDTTGKSGDIGDASNPGARVAGDGGPAVYNSFESEADGSGVENAAHEKSHTVKYHDGAKPIKATLYRKEEVGLKFLCICGADFALKAEVDAHAHEIEMGKHRRHGQSYARARIGRMRMLEQFSLSANLPEARNIGIPDSEAAKIVTIGTTDRIRSSPQRVKTHPPHLGATTPATSRLRLVLHRHLLPRYARSLCPDIRLTAALHAPLSPASLPHTSPSTAPLIPPVPPAAVTRPRLQASRRADPRRRLFPVVSIRDGPIISPPQRYREDFNVDLVPFDSPLRACPAAVGHGRCASFDAFAACTSIHATRAFSGIALHRMLRASFRDAPLGVLTLHLQFVPCVHGGAAAALATMQDTRIGYRSRRVEQLARGTAQVNFTVPPVPQDISMDFTKNSPVVGTVENASLVDQHCPGRNSAPKVDCVEYLTLECHIRRAGPEIRSHRHEGHQNQVFRCTDPWSKCLSVGGGITRIFDVRTKSLAYWISAQERCKFTRTRFNSGGVLLGVEYAPRRDAPWYDFLAATQLERGTWEHGNPDGIDEVSLPGQQMKGDSAREEQMRGILRKLGLQPGEFKCYYL
ncbi:hypothetical protein B0H16DRAFT_1479029 [Mycena metata]|uniref:Uncharacterized protein n=1 Tax=Mycena metata TaxID=1033252 RepID=A0AAD7H641_9AGAR|nr:hypothetical protein B0H16DRAFT_1479029 [Mycena metata]